MKMEDEYFSELCQEAIQLEILYQRKACELKQLFTKHRKREQEVERKKKILSIMYDEIRHIHREIDLIEEQLKSLDQDYLATRGTLSSIIVTVPSDDMETFAYREESYVHYQVKQVNSVTTAKCVLEMIRRRQVALQYLANVTYCKYLEHKHNLSTGKKKQRGANDEQEAERDAPGVPPRFLTIRLSNDMSEAGPISKDISTRDWVDVPRLNFDNMVAGESSSTGEGSGVSECTIVIDGNEEPSEDLLDFEFVPET